MIYLTSTCKEWAKEMYNIFNEYEHIKILNNNPVNVFNESVKKVVLHCCSKNPYNSFNKALRVWADFSYKNGMDTVLILNYNCNKNHANFKNMSNELVRAYYDFTK
jgi:hypothetical protein